MYCSCQTMEDQKQLFKKCVFFSNMVSVPNTSGEIWIFTFLSGCSFTTSVEKQTNKQKCILGHNILCCSSNVIWKIFHLCIREASSLGMWLKSMFCRSVALQFISATPFSTLQDTNPSASFQINPDFILIYTKWHT